MRDDCVVITTTSAGIELATTHADALALDPGARAARCGGVATFPIVMTAAR